MGHIEELMGEVPDNAQAARHALLLLRAYKGRPVSKLASSTDSAERASPSRSAATTLTVSPTHADVARMCRPLLLEMVKVRRLFSKAELGQGAAIGIRIGACQVALQPTAPAYEHQQAPTRVEVMLVLAQVFSQFGYSPGEKRNLNRG